MLLGHIVVNGNKMFVLNLFDCDVMLFIGLVVLEWKQSDTATAYECVAHRTNNIITHRTNVKLRAQHIRRNIFIYNGVTRH